ncbi:MAG: hypothetical protein QXZ68_04030 [Candidatus Bathyarchaeia archaeon]
MPSITTGYLYTFFALIAVSGILIASFVDYANAIRFSSEVKTLRDLMDFVAAEATELLTAALTANASAETYIEAPAAIGDKQYWLALRNDSVRVWLEGGFGKTPTISGVLCVYLTVEAEASGYYVGGYGAICLTCSTGANAPKITISALS